MGTERGFLVLHWTARVASLLSLGVLLLFFVGEGFDPSRLGADEWVLFCFFPLGITVGMLLGWRWEGSGGAITVLSLVAFYGVHMLLGGGPPRAWAFVLFALAGVFFLASSWTFDHVRKTAA